MSAPRNRARRNRSWTPFPRSRAPVATHSLPDLMPGSFQAGSPVLAGEALHADEAGAASTVADSLPALRAPVAAHSPKSNRHSTLARAARTAPGIRGSATRPLRPWLACRPQAATPMFGSPVLASLATTPLTFRVSRLWPLQSNRHVSSRRISPMRCLCRESARHSSTDNWLLSSGADYEAAVAPARPLTQRAGTPAATSECALPLRRRTVW